MTRRRNHDPECRERGVILVVVLWTVATLALLVSAFNWSVRGSTSVLVSEITNAKRTVALEAGLEIAAAQALANHDNELWRPNGSPQQIQFGGQNLSLSVQDANGLIDLNKADGELLLGLLRQFTTTESEAQRIRDRILDWRDRDNNIRLNGAEDFDYRKAGLSYGSGNMDFVHVTQLGDVLGVDPVLFREMAPFLTIYSNDGRVNARTAPPEVLLSIPGTSTADVERARAGQNPTSGSPGNRTGDQRGTFAETSNSSGRVAMSSRLLSRDRGNVIIVRVVLLSNDGETGPAVRVALLPAADPKAPYRVLSWDVQVSIR